MLRLKPLQGYFFNRVIDKLEKAFGHRNRVRLAACYSEIDPLCWTVGTFFDVDYAVSRRESKDFADPRFHQGLKCEPNKKHVNFTIQLIDDFQKAFALRD